ncbi:MAG TPA: right-handed parallel beta-helix repeat-containing protein [Solirubrobacterales bacterium]
MIAGAIVGALLLVPALAFAHLERPSYWPDPNPERVDGKNVGGVVPKARSLGSALKAKGASELHVVCRGKDGKKSLSLLGDSIKDARKGWTLRPSQGEEKLSKKKGKKLQKTNKKLAKECEFKSVQDAVNAADNHDRIVVMPGLYTEPKSRKAPLNDPRCNPSMLQETQSGAVAPSYEYQAECPNDQNLIHIQGRAVQGEPLSPPRPDRHGIPEQEAGECIRCGLQLEGSGVKPEDVILDAGEGYENPNDPGARPGGDLSSAECNSGEEDNPCFAKHVVLRTDRTDGFVGRNFLMRGAQEHGFYTEESDGVLLDRVKFFWNADYGHLSFTTDHHVVQNCDGFGSGDAVVYPGAAPQTGEFRNEEFYPEQRYNTTIKRCDLHGSAMGYSGSMGNSVRVTENRFYGNANGLTTDTLSAPGHPGFPADGMKIDNNWFYANNLDVYRDENPFLARVPQAVGTGFMWPGNNDGRFENNWVFDNWRQGTFLISIPDAIAGDAEGEVDPNVHCPSASEGVSTSCDNQYSGNRMGQVPPDFEPHGELTKFGNPTSLTGGSGTAPNGLDFWWDEATPNTGNCWPGNTGPDGTRESLTADPPIGPTAGQSMPGTLPEDCASSVGSPAYAAKVPMLLECFAQWESGELDAPGCGWFNTPPQPGTRAADAERRDQQRLQERLAGGSEAEALEDWVSELSGQVSLGPQG